jgi:hypothetical protein
MIAGLRADFFNLGPRIQGRSANYITVTPYYQICRERYRDKLHTEILT